MTVDELAPAPYNPRRISAKALEGLSASIERFGLVQPVVWNRATGHVVGGHQRIRVLQQQGITETDVLVVDLGETEERALNVALNSPAIAGEFRQEDLDELLIEVQENDPLLFDDLLLDELVSGSLPKAEGKTPKDSVPAPPDKAATEPGALYELGGHRLLCGNSTVPADVERLMGDAEAALFATDPPYLVDYTGADRPNESGKDWSDRYREVEIKDAEGFFRAVFSNGAAICRDNAACYCWHAHKRAALIEAVWDELGVLNHQQIVWVKPTALHGFSFWPYRHEPCLMGWKRGHKPGHDGDNSHRVTTVWEVDWEGKSRVVGNEHPTQKPVEIFARPMRKHTRPGDVCFEPFAGSGSQIVAAEETGRRCFAIELEPLFCDVVRSRWAEYVHGEGCDWQDLTPRVAA